MTITTYGFMARTPCEIGVYGHGHSVYDGFESMLSIPVSKFPAGHSFLLVVTGVLGDFHSFTRSSPAIDLHVELGFREGSGTYWGLGDMRMDPFNTYYQALTSSSPTGLGWWHHGFPFQMMYQLNQPTGDLHLVARVKRPNTPRGGSWDFSSAGMEITMLVWDLTVLGSGNYQIAGVTTPQTFPATLTDLQNISGAGGAWVIYHSALATTKQIVAGSAGCIAHLWS